MQLLNQEITEQIFMQETIDLFIYFLNKVFAMTTRHGQCYLILILLIKVSETYVFHISIKLIYTYGYFTKRHQVVLKRLPSMPMKRLIRQKESVHEA